MNRIAELLQAKLDIVSKEKDTHKRIARLNTSNSKFNLGFDLTTSEPKKEIVRSSVPPLMLD